MATLTDDQLRDIRDLEKGEADVQVREASMAGGRGSGGREGKERKGPGDRSIT